MDNSKEISSWLDNVLQELEGVQFKRKGTSRVRVDLDPDALPALLELLQGRASYVHMSAISCVDWIEDDQFELIYHVWSYELHSLVSAHIRIPREPGIYISVYDLYKPAAFFERDIHEMFGIFFEGAPDMDKFILTEWDGPPPMRKDFDTLSFVNETFEWQHYHPEWLREIEAQGGGVAVTPPQGRIE